MSDVAPHLILTPRTVGGRGEPRVLMGVEGGAGALQVRGNQLNWELFREVLGLQLVCGPNVRSTRVTSGDRRDRDRGRDVAGHLEQLFRVIALVGGSTGSGTRVRELLGVEADPTGLLVLRADSIMLTPEGLVNLSSIFTSGGYPRSEFDAAGQAGEVPGALLTSAPIASWLPVGATGRSLLAGRGEAKGGLAMPIRYELLARQPVPRGEDATARPGDDVLHVWGVVADFSEKLQADAPPHLYGTDPALYQEDLRRTPLVAINRDKLVGDDEPPPKRKKKRKPLGDPGEDDEDEDEDEDEDDEEDEPKNPQDPAVFVPPGAPGVYIPGSFDGKVPGIVLLSTPSVGTVSSPTAEAFPTETGNAVNPHPLTTNPDEEDLEDYAAGGTPDPSSPAAVPCPIDPGPGPGFYIPGSFDGKVPGQVVT